MKTKSTEETKKTVRNIVNYNAKTTVKKGKQVFLNDKEITLADITALIKTLDNGEDQIKDLHPKVISTLVANYYRAQHDRIKFNNQIKALDKLGLPDLTSVAFHWEIANAQEERVFRAMSQWVNLSTNLVGNWCMAQCGIGPILTAGLLASIDITKCETAGSIMRYFGQDPTCQWITDEDKLKSLIDNTKLDLGLTDINILVISSVCAKLGRSPEFVIRTLEKKYEGEMVKVKPKDLILALKIPPYNLDAKVLAFKIGDSFLKTYNNPKSVYGKLIVARQVYENEKNERGEYAEQAAERLKTSKKTSQSYEYYQQGKLSPSHIMSRSKRYAVKIFISHLHAIMYWDHFKRLPVKPYAISILDHKDFIKIPFPEIVNFPEEEYYKLTSPVQPS